MRPLTRLLNAWSEPPFWSLPDRLVTRGMTGEKETIANDFTGLVEHAYKQNGIVFACLMVRQMVFSEIRFQWRRFNNGRPGDLFGNPELEILERPWPNGTTGELLSRMEQDASLAGNFFGVRVEDGDGLRLRRLRPDWVTILTGSPTDDPFDYRAQPVGYIYKTRPAAAVSEKVVFTPEQIVHYSPIPDPAAQWRGMSWLTPVLEEISSDKAATKHKRKMFENGAVAGLTLSYDPMISPDDFKEYVKLFDEQHAGVDNSYKTLHLGGGADPKSIAANFRQLDFKGIQGASETRIAAASGLGAVMAQFSEGLAGSSLNTGNFTAARKRSETILFRPLWRMAAAALESVVKAPDGAHLWYDTRDVAFLRDDAMEEASIRKEDASTLSMLINSGWKPDTAKKAVITGDFDVLEHTGKTSVQLQDPDDEGATDE